MRGLCNLSMKRIGREEMDGVCVYLPKSLQENRGILGQLIFDIELIAEYGDIRITELACSINIENIQ
jgi:hypothetical protein